MIGGLRPPSIDEKGVIGAIEYLADAQNQGGMQVEFVHDVKFTRLTSLQETTVYRIVQEALHNAQRHSGSERARVVLKQRGKTIYLEIRDWGKGFDPKTTSGGVYADASAFNKKVKLLFLGIGGAEGPNTRNFSDQLTKAGITNVYYESPGTAHEWLTWRRCFFEFAPRLFQSR